MQRSHTMPDYFEIYYNQESAFDDHWISDDIRLGSAEEIAAWLTEQVKKGPLLITSIREV